MSSKKIIISIIGGHQADSKVEQFAYNIGKLVAKVDAILLCGGLKGVMQAASKGAKEADGLTIGLLPGTDKRDANPYIDIALPTSLGYARNVIVACGADIIIALPGSNGTRCEISYGLVYRRPVLDLGDWSLPGMIKVRDLKDAERKIKKLIKDINARAAGS